MTPSTSPIAATSRPSGQRASATVLNRAVRRSRRRPRRARASNFADVVGVGGVLARVAGRVHAGRAAERVDLEPGVVGDRGQAGRLAQRDGLEPRVVLERRRRSRRPRGRRRVGATSSTSSPASSEDGADLAPPCRGWRWRGRTRSGRSHRRAHERRGAGGSASSSRCRAKISAIPDSARPSSWSSSPRENGDALGGALHLDEAALAGHHHVHVDLGARVLRVVEVEARQRVDDPHRDRGALVGERVRRASSRPRRAASSASCSAT